MSSVRRRWTLGALLVVLAGCGDDAPPVAPETITVETFRADVDAGGYFAPFPRERFGELEQALAGAPDDLVCITYLWLPEDRAALRAAVSSAFPYAYEPATDDDTAVDDPTDASGAVPALFDAPPCTGELAAALDAHVTCLSQQCSTIPGSMDGRTIGLQCVSACDATHSALGKINERCHSCFHAHLWSGATFSEMRERCETMDEPLGHLGDAGELVLSKFPIESSTVRVMPASFFRMAVASVRVRTPAGRSVDLHCADTDWALRTDYTGRYGDATTGYATEHALQISQLMAHVKAWSGDRVAFVGGSLHTSPGYDGSVPIAPEAPDQSGRLASAFTLAVPDGFVPACTSCPENPLVGGGARFWSNPIYASGIDAAQVTSATRTWLGEVTDVVDPAKGETRVPFLLEYGTRTSVSLR